VSRRFWIDQLPSTDAAFGPLRRALELDPEEWQDLERAHRQAVSDATWGHDLDAMEARAESLRRFADRQAERDDDGTDAAHVRSAELEALGYALGLTAVRVAIREHDTVEAVAA
jgi:hypothetical protein